MTLGDVIGAAYNEWHEACENGDGTGRFTVDGRTEHIDRFDVLLLCRLAEAGFVIGVRRAEPMTEFAARQAAQEATGGPT